MYGDQLLLLQEGKTIATGTPAQVLTETLLRESYGCSIRIDSNPCGGVPLVLAVPEKFRFADENQEMTAPRVPPLATGGK